MLRKDCMLLYGQFPPGELSSNVPNYEYEHSLGIRLIPEKQWLASIRALHPYQVCSYQGGILMWITWWSGQDEGKYWNGYYVEVNPTESPLPQAATNHFVFEHTDEDGILRLKQLKF